MARERETGVAAVLAAARLCEAVRRERVAGRGAGKLDKNDRSPVTVADFGAQALVCRAIRMAFPDDPIVAEEDSAALREPGNRRHQQAVSEVVAAALGQPVDDGQVAGWIDEGNGAPEGRYWVLDPIDGTKGFLRNDQYAIALALIDDGTVQWGFLGCPVLEHEGRSGVLFVAQRRQGSEALSLEGEVLGPIHCSAVAEPAEARLVESVEAAHTDHGRSGGLKRTLGIERASLGMDSQAKYAAVARGQVEIYLRAPNPRTPDYRERIWDHAAGWLVVQEAGGMVTDVEGRPLDWRQGRRLDANRGVLATNGRLHGRVVAALETEHPPA